MGFVPLMNDTPNLALPYILAAQAQKHVTHNEAIRAIDCLVHLSVVSRTLTAPPGSPGDGSRYIAAADATGAWAGRAGKVAAYQDGAWAFYAPKHGWRAWCEAEAALLIFQDGTWTELSSQGSGDLPDAFDNLVRIGINATGDTTNRLALKSPASLFDNEGAGHQQKINKYASGDTASVLYQTNYSGRAEMGLAGDDDFHFKVSPNGSTWFEALKIDCNTGRVSFPIMGGPREVLTANRTYYVRTDGLDSNTGLANTSGGAFKTIQKAIDAAAALDLSLYDVLIRVGAGTYGNTATLKTTIGAGLVSIIGDATTPANVVINTGSAACFSANSITGRWAVSGFKTITAGGAIQVLVQSAALELGVMDYGDAAGNGAHIFCGRGANVLMGVSTQTISATTFGYHYYLDNNGVFYGGSRTTTLTGNPSFLTYALVKSGANLRNGSETFSGSVASGKKYEVTLNGTIESSGTTFPGPTAGTSATGGQYV